MTTIAKKALMTAAVALVASTGAKASANDPWANAGVTEEVRQAYQRAHSAPATAKIATTRATEAFPVADVDGDGDVDYADAIAGLVARVVAAPAGANGTLAVNLQEQNQRLDVAPAAPGVLSLEGAVDDLDALVGGNAATPAARADADTAGVTPAADTVLAKLNAQLGTLGFATTAATATDLSADFGDAAEYNLLQAAFTGLTPQTTGNVNEFTNGAAAVGVAIPALAAGADTTVQLSEQTAKRLLARLILNGVNVAPVAGVTDVVTGANAAAGFPAVAPALTEDTTTWARLLTALTVKATANTAL